MSILRVPGVEALLDRWRTKPSKAEEYTAIFDGRMCRLKLRAPDGSLFFSNQPHEIKGPDNELRIGVNLGVDWYVLSVVVASSNLSNPAPGSLISVATSHRRTRRVPPRSQSVTYHPNIGTLSYVQVETMNLNYQLLYIKFDVHKHTSWPEGTITR